MTRLRTPAEAPFWLADYTRSIEQALREAENVAPEPELGWVQIGPDVATTSGSTVTFASIPADYSDLLFVFVGVSPSGTANLTIGVSDNGSDYSNEPIIGLSFAASSTIYSAVLIPNYTSGEGLIIQGVTGSSITATRGIGDLLNGGSPGGYRLPSAITHVRFTLSSGTFDAGLIRLFGR